MQTDPNLANFLYDPSRDKMTLIDFGASREYSKEFMDGWYRLLTAALRGDREDMRVASEEIGYLTGEENEVSLSSHNLKSLLRAGLSLLGFGSICAHSPQMMLNAHLDSMALVASPFGYAGLYDFANQTITDSVRKLIPIMLKHRLTPPPPETYSLNRKLSGAFLMCAKLRARVDCTRLWEAYVGGYQVGEEMKLDQGLTSERGAGRVAATA